MNTGRRKPKKSVLSGRKKRTNRRFLQRSQIARVISTLYKGETTLALKDTVARKSRNCHFARTLPIINRENCVSSSGEYITYGSRNARMTVRRTRLVVNRDIGTAIAGVTITEDSNISG